MTVAMTKTIDQIIAGHAARVGRPFGKCKKVSHGLADDLVINGYPAIVLRCSGYEGDAPNADKRWLDLAGKFWWVHYIVRIDETIYDLTRRQFHPSAPKISIQTPIDLKSEWNSVTVDLDWQKTRFE